MSEIGDAAQARADARYVYPLYPGSDEDPERDADPHNDGGLSYAQREAYLHGRADERVRAEKAEAERDAAVENAKAYCDQWKDAVDTRIRVEGERDEYREAWQNAERAVLDERAMRKQAEAAVEWMEAMARRWWGESTVRVFAPPEGSPFAGEHG